MILVTGAAGKTGQAVIQALLDRELAVRAWVHRAEHGALLELLGVREVVTGDLRSTDAAAKAVRGVRTIYHIGPNVHPDEEAIGRVTVAAAGKAGCERFVYHSVLHPQTESMPHHWRKLRVEEALLASGLRFTIVRPAPYMQNLLAGWDRIAKLGIHSVPYAAETRFTMVDLDDVAEAVAAILSEPGHGGATYELSGPGFLSQNDVAEALARQFGREVRVAVETHDAWGERARATGLDDDRVETLTKMFRYYERHGLRGNPGVLQWLLGRPPTSFAEFVDKVERRRAVGR